MRRLEGCEYDAILLSERLQPQHPRCLSNFSASVATANGRKAYSAWSQLLRRLVSAHPRGTQPSRISWRAAESRPWLSVMG